MSSLVAVASAAAGAHDLISLAELAADLLDRNRKLRCGRGRGFDIRGSCVGAVHRAFGALQSVIGGRQQQFGRRLHGGGALAHGFENMFDARAERADRHIDGAAALLALTQRVALLLGGKLFGDVAMGGEPAAAAHRPADQRDDAPVLEFDGFGFGSAFSRLAQNLGDIAIGIAAKVADGEPMHQQIA
jgi:hypothetical protein